MNTKFYFPALCMLAAAAVNTVSANAQDPIYEPEEGTTISFTKTGNMLMASAGSKMDATDNTAEIHFCDNGNVYFFNMLAFPETGVVGGDTYILGKRDGNKITVDVPQLDFIEDNEIYATEITHTLNLLVPSDNVPMMPGMIYGWTQWFAPAEGNNQITFFIDEAGNITLSLEEGQAIANCAEPYQLEDAWSFGYLSLKFAPKEGQDLSVYLPTTSEVRTEPIYEPEEGTTINFAKTGNMLMASAGSKMDVTDNTAEIHFCDNGNVYFFNMLAFPETGVVGGDTYILGKRDGNKITVDVPQLDFIEDNEIYGAEITHTLNLLVPSDNVPMMPGMIYGWTQWFAPAEGNNQITFFIDEVGNITLSLEEGQAIANCAEPSYQDDAWSFGYLSLKFAPKEGQDLSVYLPNVVGVNGIESNRTAVAEKYFDLSGKAVKTPVKGSVYVRVVEYTDGTSKSFKTVVR